MLSQQRNKLSFSIVGIHFSDKRKSSTADTLADMAFAKINGE